MKPDRFREECAVVGIASHAEAANLAYLGLYALQHRGKESCGIATRDGKNVHVHKGMGLVADNFSAETLEQLPGRHAIGHVRYSTSGSSVLRDAMPFVASSGDVGVSLVEQPPNTLAKATRTITNVKGTAFIPNLVST